MLFRSRATNRTPVILPYFSLFHYADFDAAGAASGDSAVIRGTDQQLQVITDSGSAISPPARIDYAASGGVLTGRQVGVYPSVRNLLTDGANSVLSNGLAPFGPGDYSGAFHWSTLALGPSEGNDTITGSVVIHITTRCKADYNENGSIGVNDIFAFLTDWFSGCP